LRPHTAPHPRHNAVRVGTTPATRRRMARMASTCRSGAWAARLRGVADQLEGEGDQEEPLSGVPERPRLRAVHAASRAPPRPPPGCSRRRRGATRARCAQPGPIIQEAHSGGRRLKRTGSGTAPPVAACLLARRRARGGRTSEGTGFCISCSQDFSNLAVMFSTLSPSGSSQMSSNCSGFLRGRARLGSRPRASAPAWRRLGTALAAARTDSIGLRSCAHAALAAPAPAATSAMCGCKTGSACAGAPVAEAHERAHPGKGRQREHVGGRLRAHAGRLVQRLRQVEG